MVMRCNRVYDSIPLYDILNQFQKGNSHMAVVVKSRERNNDATEVAISKREMLKREIDSCSYKVQAAQNGN